MASSPDVSIAVPCYNEEDVLELTITRLAEEFRQRGVSCEIVAVDNGSADRTGAIIDELIESGLPVVKRVIPENRGYGFGVRTGLAAGRGRFVGSIPADGQVDPRDVVQLCETLLIAREPTLVKVRRRFRLDGLYRKIVSVFYNGFTNLMFLGLGSIDINGSPKIFPREYLDQMDLESDDWFLDAEILIKARRLGLRVFEQNVLAQARGGGTSNVGRETIVEFLANLMWWRVFGRARVPGHPVTPELAAGPEAHTPAGAAPK